MKGYLNWVEKYIKYCGFKMEPEKFVKFVLMLAIVMLSFSIVIYFISGVVACLSILVILVIAELFLHFILVFISNKRAHLTEEVLPDVLRLIASNLRAGILPEKALIMSARPEFGPLSEQIKEAGKCLVVGESIEKAFKVIPERINSPILRKTINLIIEGIVKGGNLAPLLENLAEDIKSSIMLKRDIRAHVTSYTMFILLAIGIGSPILYAASLFLTETLIKLTTILPTQTFQTGVLSISLAGINLSGDFIFWYSVILMIVAAIFGSILIGLIQEGKEFAGVKYIPFLVTVELAVFYFVKFKVLSFLAII
jgi:flagellar protein FlaJ